MVTAAPPTDGKAGAGSRSGFGTPVLGRVDPPENRWAGRWIEEPDVALSSGDDRDWFRYQMRLRAHLDGMKRFRQARRYRRKLSSGFEFAQVMFVGDMGAKKSVSAAHEAYKWFQRGHPFFHNGGFNFGRLVEGSDIYELVDAVPRNSVIGLDEAHTGLESPMAMSTGVRSFGILEAGLRKKNCKILLMSAMAKMIVRTVRDMTSEVRRPLKVNIQENDHGFKVDYAPHLDPRNFVVVYEVWRDFPFRGIDLTEGKRARKDGLGPPDDVRMVQGDSVRNAYLLTDSFRPVDTAHAQRFAGKAAMDAARAGNNAAGGLSDDHRMLISYLWQFSASGGAPRFIQVEAIALELEMESSHVGRLMRGLFGTVDGIKKKGGYDMMMLQEAIAAKFTVG